jgi:hypothetical protein
LRQSCLWNNHHSFRGSRGEFCMNHAIQSQPFAIESEKEPRRSERFV